jgi:D-alanyl-D-alanine carboxypeptidase
MAAPKPFGRGMAVQSCRQRRWRRFGLVALAAAVVHASLTPALAQATGQHAVLVVDANTGRVLYQREAGEPRYPASLVKLMTLYLVFERIEAGRLDYRTKIRFSANAVTAPPSKLDVEEGTEIELIDAIKALITKSANDVAVAVAEHIAGSEERFAEEMTEKARQLGMTATHFRNASGLPDERQVTTARDMIVLALRLQDDFPKHYPLFATRTFNWGEDTFRNHNTLLFSYAGLDGMKTGYTRASGFNLVASVRREGKHVLAAVFGGKTAALRNAAMRTHLNAALIKASEKKTRRPGPLLTALARAAPTVVAAPVPQPATPPTPAGVQVVRVRPVFAGPQPQDPASTGQAPAGKSGAAPAITSAAAPSQFHIQVGSFQSQGEAERQLAAVRQRAGAVLGERAALTTEFRRGDKTFYRARYTGFDAQASATVVCDELKRLSIECLVMKAE